MLTCVLGAGSGVQCARHTPSPLACSGGGLVPWGGQNMCSWKTVCESLPHCFFEGGPDRVRTSVEHQPESDRLGFEPTMSFGEFSFSGLISSSIK